MVYVFPFLFCAWDRVKGFLGPSEAFKAMVVLVGGLKHLTAAYMVDGGDMTTWPRANMTSRGSLVYQNSKKVMNGEDILNIMISYIQLGVLCYL